MKGPLWVARGGFNRRGKPPANDLHWTIYNVMQNIMDRVYTAKNVARYGDILNGFKFGCSAHFPGTVEPPADPNAALTVKINGSYLKPFKHALMHEERPARRPTGAYLAPGTIATVKVPQSIVGKGYQVRVGAHSWDNARKPRILRLDRSSLVYSIDRTEVNVASPLGGGIYIEVPMKADAGIVEVTISNAVRSPYFSAKPFHRTSLAEWQNVERKHKAPWADLQSEKFMMQVPTSWICKLDDPVALMKNWDAAMDALNDLMGLPRVWGKETMYLQVDLQNRSRVFAPGYPTVNGRYDPRKRKQGDEQEENDWYRLPAGSNGHRHLKRSGGREDQYRSETAIAGSGHQTGRRRQASEGVHPGSKQFEFEGKIYAGYKESPLSWDKGTQPKPIAWYAGKQYDDGIGNAKKVLEDIGKYYPGAKSCEVAGFVWWQGHKDQNAAHASRYEQNLVHLIKTLRKDLNAPNAKFVMATIAFGGDRLSGHGLTVAKAQLAVSGETGKYPEFKGNVKTIDARPYWREKDVSPSGAGYHYNHNAETHMEVGNLLGWAMADLLKKR